MSPKDHREACWGFYICDGRCTCTSKPFLLFHVGLTSVVKLLAVVLTIVADKDTSYVPLNAVLSLRL